MSDLADLIEELASNRTCGGRDLDLAIAKTALGMRPVATIRGTQVHNPNQPGVSWDLRNYTTSVDAALTLIPNGARLRELGQWWDIDKPGGWFCNIMVWEWQDGTLVERAYTYGFADDDRKMPATAPTAALAVCIVVCKVRDASGLT